MAQIEAAILHLPDMSKGAVRASSAASTHELVSTSPFNRIGRELNAMLLSLRFR